MYFPASLKSTFFITSDGEVVVDPPYLAVFEFGLIVVIWLPLFSNLQYTLVAPGLDMTLQPIVMSFPTSTGNRVVVRVTVGTSKVKENIYIRILPHLFWRHLNIHVKFKIQSLLNIHVKVWLLIIIIDNSLQTHS